MGVKFFDFLGVKNLEEARKVDAVTLRDKCEEFCAAERFMWGTVADGKYLMSPSDVDFQMGKRMPVPLIVGGTIGEIMGPMGVRNMDDFRRLAERSFPEYADRYMELIGSDFPTAMDRTRVSGAEMAARAMKTFDRKSGKDNTIYLYKFNPEMPGYDHPGTFHSSDLWFHFETLAKCWRPFTGKHYDLARQMCNALCFFIKNGDPNGMDVTGLPQPLWKPFTLEEPNVMFWGDTPRTYLEESNELKDLLVDIYVSQVEG